MGASGLGADVGDWVGVSVGEGETVSVGVGVGVSVGLGVGVGVGVGVADSVAVGVGDGDSVAAGVLGITDGKGCGGGGSVPRNAQSAVTASAPTVASASHVQTGLSFAGASSAGSAAPTGSNGSVGCWSAMGPG